MHMRTRYVRLCIASGSMIDGSFRGVQNIGHIEFYTTSTMTSNHVENKMIRITVLIAEMNHNG